jgi:hypothetical protein
LRGTERNGAFLRLDPRGIRDGFNPFIHCFAAFYGAFHGLALVKR